jgi:hypothetical protein
MPQAVDEHRPLFLLERFDYPFMGPPRLRSDVRQQPASDRADPQELLYANSSSFIANATNGAVAAR